MLRVTAPIAEAQLVETALLATVNFQTSVASKAARVVISADSRPVLEFGARRAHGLEAALCAARAAFLAGCSATSLVEAGRRWSIPLIGTMAHSWIMSAADEIAAFREYGELFGEHSVLLLDTYDTLAAARAVVDHQLRPAAVRLDSGDLAALSREVRGIFDAAGLSETRIFVSGDLDEFEIARLLATGAPVDGFGVGTSVVTSIDAPAPGGVYKLVEVIENGRPRLVMKTSTRESHLARAQAGLAAHGRRLRKVRRDCASRRSGCRRRAAASRARDGRRYADRCPYFARSCQRMVHRAVVRASVGASPNRSRRPV